MAAKFDTDAGPDASTEVAKDYVGVVNKDENQEVMQKVPTLKQEKETLQSETTKPVTKEICSEDQMKLEKNSKEQQKVILEFAPCVILFGFSELLSIRVLPVDSLGYLCLMIIAIHGCLTLISGLFLLIHTLFMLTPGNTIIHPVHHNISDALVIISCASLFFASVVPLFLLPKPYNFLISIVLVPLFLSLALYFYLRTGIDDKKTEEDQTEYEEHLRAITRLSELSQATVSLSFGGLIGLLSGIYKNAPNHSYHPSVSVTIVLIFVSYIFSTVLMFLCQMEVLNFSSRARKNFLRTAAAFCMFLLILLACAACSIAFMFLQWYIVIVFIPVLIPCGVWLYINLPTRDHHNDRDILPEADLKLTYTTANKVTSLSFGGITAIFAGYLKLSDDKKNMYLNLCMIFLASAFVSGVSLMLLSSYKSPIRSHVGLVISLLRYFGIYLLLFGGLTAIILEFSRL